AAAISALAPNLEERTRRLVERLRTMLSDEDRAVIHGDFYAAQVIAANGEFALIDLDEAAIGPAAADLGNFIAHLEKTAMCGTIHCNDVARLTDALLRGYGANRQLTRDATTWSIASLLRLAPEPFRARQPNWSSQLEAIVLRAEQLLEHAP